MVSNIFFKKITTKDQFSYLLAFFPVSFIAGNTIINLNLLLIVILGIYHYGKKIFSFEYSLIDKLFLYFFLFTIFGAIVNDLNYYLNFKEFSDWKGNFSTTLKSLAYFRFFIFYLIIKQLIILKNINFKLFFISGAFFSFFVCLDIFYQIYFGRDIFGYESVSRKFPGPFGNEPIAGGFILRHSLLALFLFPIYFKFKSKIRLAFLILFILLIYTTAIIISGNRISLIFFIFLIMLTCLFQKNLRKIFFPFLFFLLLSFSLLFNFNTKIKLNFLNLKYQITEIVSLFGVYNNDKKFSKIEGLETYLDQFKSFEKTWLLNKYIGGGIKNFRFNCHIAEKKQLNSDYKCNMHPHNYYLEILSETGLIGFIFLIAAFGLSFYKIFFKRYFKHLSENYNITSVFYLLLFVEIFPIKSTGSFFTTGNATYIFLITGILVGLLSRDKIIEK